ncbi:TPA: hypothetical protein TZ704_002044 [Streptococcus suis]|nr:hypothetical protein [Streptococcus suis]
MKITFSENIVSWEYKNSFFEINVPKVIHAKYDKNENIVVVSCGDNFITEEYFYYSMEGKMLGKQNVKEETVEWNYDRPHKLTFQFTNNILFCPSHKLIFSIFRQSNDRGSISKLEVYNFYGQRIYRTDSPVGYTMIYIADINEKKLKIACEAIDKANYDSYGRSRFYFNLDLATGEWEKSGLAY